MHGRKNGDIWWLLPYGKMLGTIFRETVFSGGCRQTARCWRRSYVSKTGVLWWLPPDGKMLAMILRGQDWFSLVVAARRQDAGDDPSWARMVKGMYWWLPPDGKTQGTIEEDDGLMGRKIIIDLYGVWGAQMGQVCCEQRVELWCRFPSRLAARSCCLSSWKREVGLTGGDRHRYVWRLGCIRCWSRCRGEGVFSHSVRVDVSAHFLEPSMVKISLPSRAPLLNSFQRLLTKTFC